MHIIVKLVDGKVLEFDTFKPVFTVGRSNKSDIVIPHEGVSRQHCQIEVDHGDVFITDLGSTNGVLIEGEKIEPHVRTQYATYLSLSFGAVQNFQMSFEEKSLRSYKLQKEAEASGKTTVTKMMSLEKENPSAKAQKTPAEQSAFKEKMNYIAVNILAVLILAGAVWWYMQKEETDTTEEDSFSSQPAPERTSNDQF